MIPEQRNSVAIRYSRATSKDLIWQLYENHSESRVLQNRWSFTPNNLTAYDGRLCAVISLPNLCHKAKLYRAEHSSLALTVLDSLPAS